MWLPKSQVDWEGMNTLRGATIKLSCLNGCWRRKEYRMTMGKTCRALGSAGAQCRDGGSAKVGLRWPLGKRYIL